MQKRIGRGYGQDNSAPNIEFGRVTLVVNDFVGDSNYYLIIIIQLDSKILVVSKKLKDVKQNNLV